MFKLTVDLSGLQKLKLLPNKINELARDAARDLSGMGYAHARELATDKLHSRKDQYLKALTIRQENEDTWLIILDAKASWIEEGRPQGSMVDDLLKGAKFKVIPFRHGAPAENTPASQEPMVDAIKTEMKRRKIPWSTIERDAMGRPKSGKLHSFSVNSKPLKTGFGPGQGHGPVGDVRQGMNSRQAVGGGPGGGGTPFLSRISVYQKQDEKTGQTRRDIFTFRTVSDKHRGTRRWMYPGIEGVKVLDQTYHWIIEEWEKTVAPAILEKIKT